MNGRSALRKGFASLAFLLCLDAAVWAQDADAPNSSLGDVARQNRAQHSAASESSPGKAQTLAEEVQPAEEASEAAPDGFMSYDAGEYRLLVPFPYSLEGHDNNGAVLLGSRLGLSNTEVVAGAPIPIPANRSDDDLLNAARQYARLHGTQACCSAIKQGERKAFRCSWQTSPALLGHAVFSSMLFVVASNSLIPVMCVSPNDLHQTCVVYGNWGNNTCTDRYRALYGWNYIDKAQAAADAQNRDERTAFQMCDQVIYPSIQLKEDIVVHPATIPEGKPTKSAAGPAPQDTLAAAGTQATSLADLARQSRQATRAKAQNTLDNAERLTLAPPGFQSFSLQYCRNPQQCSEASVVIPEKAEVVSRVNGQHIFKTLLNGDPVILYAGPADVNAPYRSLTAGDYIRMRDLANSNGWSREKADGVSTQELTIEGRPALMTRFRYQRYPNTWWIGERALIEDRRGQFMVGCTAPEQRFADAEALCTTLANSLRLP
jgi:hypothetical protein